jgi:hypothetical protein
MSIKSLFFITAILWSSVSYAFLPTEKVENDHLSLWLENNGLNVSCRDHHFTVGSYIRLYGPGHDITREVYHSFSSNKKAEITRTPDGGTIDVHDSGRGSTIRYRVELAGQKIRITLDVQVAPEIDLGGIEYTAAFIPRWTVKQARYSFKTDQKIGNGTIDKEAIRGETVANAEEITVISSLGRLTFKDAGNSFLTLGDSRKNPYFIERDRHIWISPAVTFDEKRRLHHEMEMTIEPAKDLVAISKLPSIECPASLATETIEARDAAVSLLPVPQKIRQEAGAWSGRPRIYVDPDDSGSSVIRVGKLLQQDMKDDFCLECSVENSSAESAAGIVLRVAEENVPSHEQAYTLDSTGNNIVITARDERGLFYGTQTLMQLIRLTGDQIRLPRVHIEDWPQIKIRAIHPARLWPTSSLEHFKKYCKLVSRYKYNMMIIEDSGSIHFEGIPYASDRSGGFTPDQVKELVRYGKSRYLEMIPQLQCLGHAEEWLARNPDDFAKYPWLKECFEDYRTRKDLCVSNPKTRELLLTMIDRINEVFEHPKYFHCGLDESFGFAKCERCSKLNPSDILADHIQALYRHLKNKGQTMMIWHDMLLYKSEGGYDDHLAGVRAKLPKDVIICDWQYGGGPEKFKAGIFKREGFRVVGCPWNDPQNVYDWAWVAEKENIEFMSTNWIFFPASVSFNELAIINGDVCGTLLGGVYSWNPDQPDENKLSPTRVMEIYGRIPVNMPYTSFKTYDLQRIANYSFDLNGFSGLEKKNGFTMISGVPFRLDYEHATLPKGTSVRSIKAKDIKDFPVNDTLNSLYLLAAISEPTGENVCMSVKISYANGNTESATLRGNQSIAMLSDPQMMTYMGIPLNEPCGWIGLLRKDQGIAVQSVGVVRFKNPYPNVAIKSLSIVSEKNQPVGILLLGITGHATSSIQ